MLPSLHPQNDFEDSPPIVALSHSMKTLMKKARRLAPMDVRVVVVGETGTGKELIARFLHLHSQRRTGNFVKIPCGALNHDLFESQCFGHVKSSFTGAYEDKEGLFTKAHLGTLFLDDIDKLCLELQSKLLRFLQNGEFSPVGSSQIKTINSRLIVSSQRDLKQLVEHGLFREDLFYRIQVVTLQAPNLRDRKTDIPQLAQIFLSDACNRMGLRMKKWDPNALKRLCLYPWRGHARQLKNIVERNAILQNTSLLKDVFGLEDEVLEQVDQAPTFDFAHLNMTWQNFQNQFGGMYIKYVLRKTGGNVTQAARFLGLERSSLHRLLRKLDISIS